MDDNQKVVLVAIFLGALVVLGAVYIYVSSEKTSGLDPAKRFTAKAGTTRDNAMLLTSKRRPQDSAAAEEAGTESESDDGRVRKVRSLSPEAPEESGEPETEADASVRRALNSMSVESGLELLEEELEGMHPPGEQAKLHAGRGVLLAQLDPPNLEEAAAAFEEARTLAPDDETLHQVVEEEAKVFLQHGMRGMMKARISASLEESEGPTAPGLRLEVLLGQLEEADGDPAAAEKRYRAALEKAVAAEPQLGDGASEVARLAGFRLARLYRSQGKESEAKAVADQVAQAVR